MAHEKNKHSYEQVKEYLLSKNYELISEEYVNTDTPISVKDEEGYMYNVYLYNIKTGQNSDRFDQRNPYIIKNIKLFCKLNSLPFELISNKYVNRYEDLEWKCTNKTCREIIYRSWSNMRKSPRCFVCFDYDNEISLGEKEVKNILLKYNMFFTQQHKFKNCINKRSLSFDFYIEHYNMAIEYQGQQHYKPIDIFGGEERFKQQQINDQIKRKYCEENNVKLLEIPYWDFNKIEEILIKELGL
jgi:hypothetical protein